MLVEYPREHAQAVVDWFVAWTENLHAAVQQDLDMVARAGVQVQEEAVFGPNGQQEQPFSVETPTSPAVPVPRSRMPPVVPRQAQPMSPALVAGLARQRNGGGRTGPVPGQVIPIGAPLPDGMEWNEQGMIVRSAKPMPTPAKAGAIPPVAAQAAPAEFPPEQPPPMTRVAAPPQTPPAAQTTKPEGTA